MSITFDAFTAHDADYAASVTTALPDVMGDVERHPCLDYSDTVAKVAYFRGHVPVEYTGTDITVTIRNSWSSDTTAANKVRWEAAFERIVSGTTDKDSAGNFAASRAVSVNVQATQGVNSEITLTFTQAQADSIAAGELYVIKIRRDVAHADDNSSGDAELDTVFLQAA